MGRGEDLGRVYEEEEGILAMKSWKKRTVRDTRLLDLVGSGSLSRGWEKEC